jgi:hypothetical protein
VIRKSPSGNSSLAGSRLHQSSHTETHYYKGSLHHHPRDEDGVNTANGFVNDAAFFGANNSAASFRMATKSKFGEKEYVE